LASDNLDGNLLPDLLSRAGFDDTSTNDGGEHPFTKVAKDLVAAVVDDLAEHDSVVAIGVVPVVRESSGRGRRERSRRNEL
jgi:hypothetical protein